MGTSIEWPHAWKVAILRLTKLPELCAVTKPPFLRRASPIDLGLLSPFVFNLIYTFAPIRGGKSSFRVLCPKRQPFPLLLIIVSYTQ